MAINNKQAIIDVIRRFKYITDYREITTTTTGTNSPSTQNIAALVPEALPLIVTEASKNLQTQFGVSAPEAEAILSDQISGEAGEIDFYAQYIPLTSGSSVVAA